MSQKAKGVLKRPTTRNRKHSSENEVSPVKKRIYSEQVLDSSNTADLPTSQHGVTPRSQTISTMPAGGMIVSHDKFMKMLEKNKSSIQTRQQVMPSPSYHPTQIPPKAQNTLDLTAVQPISNVPEFELSPDEEEVDNDAVSLSLKSYQSDNHSEHSYLSEGIDLDDDELHDPNTCCHGCRKDSERIQRYLNRVFQQNREILEIIKSNPTKALSLTPPEVYLTDQVEFNLVKPQPHDTVESLLKFDYDLSTNKAMALQLKSKIASFGGKTYKKAIHAAMASLITDELCRRVSFYGTSTTTKLAQANFVQIIIEAIRGVSGFKPKPTIMEVRKAIAEWLRRPGDRIRNRILRQKREQEREDGDHKWKIS